MGKSLLAIDHISPGQNLDAYLQTISTIPVLTVAEERVLAERLKDQNDLEAARQLVMSHLRFVVHIARSYSGYGSLYVVCVYMLVVHIVHMYI